MTYTGLMPAWGPLSDAQIAAANNPVVAELGDAPEGFVPYTADDVAAHRGDELTSAEVHEVRDQLGLD